MRRGTPVAKAVSVVFAVYVMATLVWAWAVKFRPELDKPLLVVYLTVFTLVFVGAAGMAVRWAWTQRER